MSEEAQEVAPETEQAGEGEGDVEMEQAPETETSQVEGDTSQVEGETPKKSVYRPRTRMYSYRRSYPHFMRGYPPFRGYPMPRPYHRTWGPRPMHMPSMMQPSQGSQSDEMVQSPTAVSPTQEPHSPTPHWTKHMENAIFRPCFDWMEASDAFPRVNPEIDDSALNEALSLRGEELLPSETEVKVVNELVEMLVAASERIASSEEEVDKEIKLDEAILVGSFKKRTYSKGAVTADIVALLKELPTEARVDRLSERLVEHSKTVSRDELAKNRQEIETRMEQLKTPVTKEPEDGEDKSLEDLEKERLRELSICGQKLKNLPLEPKYSCSANKLTPNSFLIISSTGASAKIFSTTEANLIKQEDNTEDRVDLSTFEFSLRMVRHAKWFESCCKSDTIPCLVRVLKDIKKRFPGWKQFHPWLMDLIAHKAVLDKSTEPREIGSAFRYMLQIISAGCFLLGFYGVEDPCEKQCPAAQYSLTDEAKDDITLAGQILLRMLQNGAYREIIGGQGIQVLDLNRPFSVGGIQFAPPQRAFEQITNTEDSGTTIES